MLDMGFWPDVRRILSLLPAKRQNMLFSATLTKDVMRVAGPDPERPRPVEVAPSATPVEGHQPGHLPGGRGPEDRPARPPARRERSSTGCSSSRAPSTAPTGSAAIWSAAASRAPPSTPTAPSRSGSTPSTASRTAPTGCWWPPTSSPAASTWTASRTSSTTTCRRQAQDYVHRIGRTARAGASGTAISFLAAEQAGELREIEVMLGRDPALPGPGGLRLHGAADPEPGAHGHEAQTAPGLQRERAPQAVARRTAPRRR